MTRYYISDDTQVNGVREVTEAEFDAFRQFCSEVKAYAEQITNGEIALSDVPETHRETVSSRLAPTVEQKAQAYDILMGVSE